MVKIVPTNFDEIGMVNCANCRRELVGERSQTMYDFTRSGWSYEFVAERIAGRPYCSGCAQPRAQSVGRAIPVEDDHGTAIYDAALRAMEERQ